MGIKLDNSLELHPPLRVTAPGAIPGLFIIGPQRRAQTPTRKHRAPNGQEHGDQQPTPGANYTQETAGVQSFKPDDTRPPSAIFPQNVSADRVLSLLTSPSLSCLLCGGCPGPLAHSVWNSSPLPGWLASPARAAQVAHGLPSWPGSSHPGTTPRLPPSLVSPPHTPLPSDFKLPVGSWATERQHARTLQIAPTGYGCRLLPYLT